MKKASKATFFSQIQERILLSRPGSTKQTYHLSLALTDPSLTYQPGDSIAIYPQNDLATVDMLIHCLGAREDQIVEHHEEQFSLRAFLSEQVDLTRVHPALLRALPLDRVTAKNQLAAELLCLSQRVITSLNDLSSLFFPLLPRFYSIASSQRITPNAAELLVTLVTHETDGKQRFGVASSFLCTRANVHKTTFSCHLEPAHKFSLPSDPAIPLIFIGAGTGIAPFRAFMQERRAIHASGKNWLFFGERNRATDFYYEEFWQQLVQEGRLTIHPAFSRDGTEKVYVQHRLFEQRNAIWAWLQEGAVLYVCGDARQMAKDVDTTLHRICRETGNLSEEEAHHFLKTLRQQGRYLVDVYSTVDNTQKH